jgi:site-specific recombinase XerD
MLDDFSKWLSTNGYHRHLVRLHVRTTRRLDQALRSRGCISLQEIAREDLRSCCPKDSQEDVWLASTVRLWERYFDERQLLPRPKATRIDLLTAEYWSYLQSVRGASVSTLRQHSWTASHFLSHLGYEASVTRLTELGQDDVETYVRARAQRANRGSLQHEIAHLRSFFRFLAARDYVKPGFDAQIDTPRLYRGEQLPRSLPWDTVCALLASIDQTTPMGLRDYAMFLMIASYGLRASEIVALKLEDIEWRTGRVRIDLRKTATPLLLPLTDAVGGSLVAYLRRARPQLSCREVFLRCRAPAGVLKPTAIIEAFQKWVKRSGLRIPFQGAHCLRHSYAVHLLRQGVSLKTIGDLLGHRSAESTCVYIRLAVEDLRDVALCLPGRRSPQEFPEVRP